MFFIYLLFSTPFLFPGGRRGLEKSIWYLSRKHFSSFHFRLRNSSALTSFHSSCRQNVAPHSYSPNPTTFLSDLTEVARNNPNSATPQSKTKNRRQNEPINHTFILHIQLRLDVREPRFTKFLTFVITYIKTIFSTCRDWFRRIGMRRCASGRQPPPLSCYTANRSQLI
jgi:hypothetical protein